MMASLYNDIIPASTSIAELATTDVKIDETKYSPPDTAVRRKGVHQVNGKSWIPNEATGLKLNIAVDSNCGERGPRAYAATSESVSSEYWWTGIREDIK